MTYRDWESIIDDGIRLRLRENAVKRFRVLIVDDEERIVNFLSTKLNALGYEVLTAGNGIEGLEQAQAQEPDFIVLDVLMPKMDGLEMLKQLRSFSTVPVIIQLGADDYMPKPFNPDELVARIEAIRRRLELSERRTVPEIYNLGQVKVDFKKHTVMVRDEEKYLTRIEWLLLGQLINNTGRLMSYDNLLTRVWGPEYRNDIQILRTWISRLRNKLEMDPNDPKLIRTISKTGYIIDQPSD